MRYSDNVDPLGLGLVQQPIGEARDENTSKTTAKTPTPLWKLHKSIRGVSDRPDEGQTEIRSVRRTERLR